MSRSLIDLHPEVRWRAEKVLEAASEISIPILIYFTLRSFAEQQALYDQGRKTPGIRCRHDGKTWEIGTCYRHPLGLPVTWAQAGESYHNYGVAFDFCIDPPGPGVSWEIAIDLNRDRISDYTQVGELGESLGLQWGGRWPEPKKDRPHFQLSFGFSVYELRTFYELGGLPRVWEEISKKNEKNKWP
jgi:peptidoglycan L-alanyl-D-glutamate endopeptidase CwlK